MASARATTLRFTAPFSGFVGANSTGGSSNACGVNASRTLGSGFDMPTGRANFQLAVTADHGATGCSKHAQPWAMESAGWRFVSPNITVTQGGSYILRSNLWLEWTFNATISIAASPPHQYATATYDFTAYMVVTDLTAGTTTGYVNVYNNGSELYDRNQSVQLHHDAWISLPISAILTTHQVYQLTFLIAATVYAGASGSPNNARATLDIGTTGHGTVLQSVTVR
jgi:hypothetical protein